VGTWSVAGKTTCEECPAGQYAYKHVSCKDCAPGSYSEGKLDACKPCGVGKVSKSKASSCTVCPAGQYADQKAFLCTPCVKDTYSTGSVDSCSPCQSGSYSGTGEKECHVCTPGEYFNLRLNKCVACLPSFYSPNPSTKCKKCPTGQYSGAKESACRSCPAGIKVNAAQTGCETVNTPPPTTPPTVIPSPSTTPSPTHSPTSSPVYQACVLGLYYDKIKKKCIKCQPGFFTIDSNTPCSRCPYGHYTPPNGLSSGPYGNCVKCPTVMNPEKTECLLCNLGYKRKVFYNGTDPFPPYPESVCERCPRNTYRGKDPDTKCLPCIYPDGTNDDQSQCIPERYSSPPTIYPTMSPTYAGSCLRGQEEVPVSTANPYGCAPCKPSYYSPYPSIPCTKCPAGEYSGNAELKCRKCPAGQTADSSQTGCVVLPSSSPTFRPSFKKNGCVPGQYDDGTSCQPCQPGYYSPDPSYECMPCAPRTYAREAGRAHCLVCGDIVNNSKTACEQCRAGWYLRRYYDEEGNETKQPECDQCQYQFGYNFWSGPNDFCHECPWDSFVNADHSGCVIDPNRYGSPSYSPSVASPSTPPVYVIPVCEKGYTLRRNYDNVSFTCVPCPISTYQDASTLLCEKCPPGTYTSLEGQTQCLGCPVGNSVNDYQTGCE
jgi:Tyrosine-protein kinase ephrin type A/B receptor-like